MGSGQELHSYSLAASLTTGPSTVQPMATASNHFTWITTGVLTSFVIMGIIITVSITRRGTEGRIQREGRSTGPGVRTGREIPDNPCPSLNLFILEMSR